MNFKNTKICIIGLGYVGLPLAIEFSKKLSVIGFDNDKKKINLLKKKYGRIIKFTSTKKNLKEANIFIVTVPTPVDSKKKPDLKPLKDVSMIISKVLKKGDLVIYESTVYPGLTEEVCIPILKKKNNLVLNKDFFVGYSPERVSPGDKNDFTRINKVISGSNNKTTNFIFKLYKKIIKANLFRASSIKVAEASKIVENVQRDINISFMNEISLIFSKLNIDTQEVLKAAKTKWNFLNFSPGLVGGHCISVDPYYLTYKAKKHNYVPKVILSGRSINQNMGNYVGKTAIIKINDIFKGKKNKIKIGIYGLTYKENVKDTRDSKVFDIINVLSKKKNFDVSVIDPYLKKRDIKLPNNIKLNPKINKLDVFILAVPHKIFLSFIEKKIKNILRNEKSLIMDIKGVIINKKIRKNFNYWSL